MTIETDQPTGRHLPEPPLAPRLPLARELHGEQLVDDYGWMRDPEDPRLHDYLAAERAYYDAYNEHLDGLAGELAAETASRFPSGDEYSVSWPRDGYTYRTRLPAGKDDVQLLRARAGETAEQLLLDENLVAERTGYVETGVREPSQDGALLAWSADRSGAEIYELRIRDLATGADLPDAIARTFPGIAWSTQSDYVLYLVPDEVFRPFQIWRHRVGAPAGEDVLVYEERDRTFDLDLAGSRSGELAIVTAAARDSTEVLLLDLTGPLAEPVLVAGREPGIEYRVDHARGGDLFLVTNAEVAEFSLMRAPLKASGRAEWTAVDCQALAPARTDTRLLQCDVLAEHLVLTVRRNCGPMIVVCDHDGGNVKEIPTSFAAGSIAVDHAEDYNLGSVIIVEESLIEPRTWYELELATGAKQLRKRMEVPGHDPARYRTERRAAPAPDGTQVPVTLAYHEDTPLDGTAPCLLYGYGAYEAVVDPVFERSLPSLLDRGVVYAIAHIRGGGECGRGWWQQGRLETKVTTFTDYLAVADWLAGSDGQALVDGSRIVTRGGSAGGLLQGAVYSMRPDRWRGVVAEVPFVDVVNTMLDPSLPLTAGEWDEWGDPRRRQDYQWMRAYSPYDNPPPAPRPSLLVTSAVNDPRVGIHEPAKWVAKLRATEGRGGHVLFRPELGVGSHGGPSGRSARIRYEADIQAFILDAMGITE